MNIYELPPHEVIITDTTAGPVLSREIDVQSLGQVEKINLATALMNNPQVSSIWSEDLGIEKVFDRKKVNNTLTIEDRLNILKSLNTKLNGAKRFSVIEQPPPYLQQNVVGILLKNPSAFEALRLIYSHALDRDTELVRVVSDSDSGRIIEKGTIKPHQMVRHESIEEIENFANSFEGNSDEVVVFMHIQKPRPRNHK